MSLLEFLIGLQVFLVGLLTISLLLQNSAEDGMAGLYHGSGFNLRNISGSKKSKAILVIGLFFMINSLAIVKLSSTQQSIISTQGKPSEDDPKPVELQAPLSE